MGVKLSQFAKEQGCRANAVRSVLNDFDIRDRAEDGQRIVPDDIARLFRLSRRLTGHWHPRGARTRGDLEAAAARLADNFPQLAEAS
jgi:hypothetical protein